MFNFLKLKYIIRFVVQYYCFLVQLIDASKAVPNDLILVPGIVIGIYKVIGSYSQRLVSFLLAKIYYKLDTVVHY